MIKVIKTIVYADGKTVHRETKPLTNIEAVDYMHELTANFRLKAASHEDHEYIAVLNGEVRMYRFEEA